MTRLHYWLCAKTIYNVHSPFVYALCRDVLFAPINKKQYEAEGIACGDRYDVLCHALRRYLKLTLVDSDGCCCTMVGDDEMGQVMVVRKPHASKESERRWDELCQDSTFRVSIDLYDVGILFANKHLRPEHFLLR